MKVIRRAEKPVVYTAVQWKGPGEGSVTTAEGWTIFLRPGDWTIIAPNGERDVCSQEAFDEMYQEFEG